MLKKTRLPQSFKSYLCSENIARTCITENKQHVILPYFQFYILLKQVHSSLYPWLYVLELPETDSHLLFMGGTAANFLQKVFGVALKLYLFWINCCCHHWLAYSKVPCLYLRRCVLQGYPRSNTESCLHWPVGQQQQHPHGGNRLFFFFDQRRPNSVSQWMATRTPKFVHLLIIGILTFL